MTKLLRVFMVVVATLATYCFVYWLRLFLILPASRSEWIPNLVSLTCAVIVGRYVWKQTTSVASGLLVTYVVMGALITGAIGFSAGFFGPMLFAPSANQGPLLGIFITGPLGFLLGAIGGAIYWYAPSKKTKVILVLLALVILLSSIAYMLVPKGHRYYLPEPYSGWICVHYNVVGASPLTTEEGFLLHKVPPNGIIITSSAPRLSPTRDEFYYYNDQGVRTFKELQHGGGFSQQKLGEQEISVYFWVSSGESNGDYERYMKNRNNSEPVCGPWRTNK